MKKPLVSREKTVRSTAAPTRRRIELIDELRGLAVLCMIFYHGFYIGSAFFGFGACLTLYELFLPAQPFFAALFILLCGVSSRLTRSNLRRGTQLFLIALALSFVTVCVAPVMGVNGAQDRFGILHLLSVSILLYALIAPLADKINPIVGACVSTVLFAMTTDVKNGFLGICALGVELPRFLYSTSFLFPLGLKNDMFYSVDYFPLFPFFFIFLCGTFLGVYARDEKLPQYFYKRRVPALGFLGKHSLACYLLHAPALYAVFFLYELIIERF